MSNGTASVELGKLSGDRMLIYMPINPRSTFELPAISVRCRDMCVSVLDDSRLCTVCTTENTVFILVALIYLLLKSVIKTSDLQAVSYQVCQWNRNFLSINWVFWVRIWRKHLNMIYKSSGTTYAIPKTALSSIQRHKGLKCVCVCFIDTGNSSNLDVLPTCISTRKIYDRHHLRHQIRHECYQTYNFSTCS